MADPIIPNVNTDEATQGLKDLEVAAATAATTTGSFIGILGSAGAKLTDFAKSISSAYGNLDELGNLAAEHVTAFNNLGATVIKARGAFDGFSSIDTSGINTFSAHFKELKEMLSVGGDVAIDAMEALKQKLAGMGVAPELITKAAAKGSAAFIGFAENMFASADRALASQSAFLQLSASTGNLGTVFNKTGDNLEGLTALMDMQNNMSKASGRATGSTAEQMTNYYMALGKIPGALQSVVSSGTGAGGTMSMLTATIKLAHGTGRAYTDVVKDLHSAFKDYNLVGEDALKFTARMSEVSNKFHIELDDVRTNLMGATSAFKNMTDAGAAAGKMTESMSSIMNNYVGRLMDAGATGAHATEMVNTYANAMAGLTIAQKSFISTQTGGPGGLMGGFKIEKLIKEGKTDEVQKLVQQTMEKQLGKIVTLDEAGKSQAAASQFEKQVLMLKQGPLGSMVKTDQDAYKMLDAMKAGKEGRKSTFDPGGGLKADGLQSAMGKGTSLEERSTSLISDITNDVSAIRARLESTSLNAMQGLFTAAPAGHGEELTSAQIALKKSRDDAARASGAASQGLQDEMGLQNKAGSAGIIKDKTKQYIKTDVNALSGDAGHIPDIVKHIVKVTGKSMSKDGSTNADGKSLIPDIHNAAAAQKASKATHDKSGVPTPDVTVHQEGNSAKFNVHVTVKVDDKGGQAGAITPAS